ncbi:MAG: immunoglobulin domain-containing protein [Planctomycetota bacterium]
MSPSLTLSRLHRLAFLSSVLAASASLRADVLYNQPATSVPTITSSYFAPDGSDYDVHVWDSFWLANAGDITEIRWRGGYGGPLPGGSNNIVDFQIAIYPSITVGYEPDIDRPLFQYLISEDGNGQPGNAGETFVGTVDGINLYDYHFVLPQTFLAAGRTNYWVQITAWQSSLPTWGFARASGGNNAHFALVPTENGDFHYVHRSGDTAYSLIGTPANCTVPAITVNPAPDEMCFNTRSVDLTVQATGTGPFTYQWRRNGYPVFDGPNGGGTGGGATITGATTAHLHVMSPSYWHEPGDYDCIVANACGPTLSGSARIDVPFGPPNVSAQPVSTFACSKGNATLSVSAAGYTPFHFAWQRESVPGTFVNVSDGPTGFGGIFSGATTNTLVISDANEGDAGRYRCVLSNACGSATSNAATLTVCPADFNCDGAVDFFDYDDFVRCFEGLACPSQGAADFDGDGAVDFFDYDAFVLAFEVGC